MSNVFNIKRAANYFTHDLNTAKNNYLYSMLVIGLMPVISFILFEIFALIINGGHFVEIEKPLQNIVFGTSIMALMITFPLKQYGRLTDRRYGSDWLMLPASTFEKWVSMILVSCLIFPVVFLALYLGSDWLLSVCFPSKYPEALVTRGWMNDIVSSLSDEGVTFNVFGASYANWVENILFITLGAVIFKRAKFPKTLLAGTGIIILIIFIIALCCGFSFTDADFEEFIGNGDPEVFARRLNVFITIVYVFVFTVLGGGLYLRLKTLKH